MLLPALPTDAPLQVVDFVCRGLYKRESLPTIAFNLVSHCLDSNKPSTDNITVTLVLFKQAAL